MRRFTLTALLLVALGVTAQAASTQVEMLRDMFRRPVTEWKDVMKESKPLLTAKFFTDVEKRVRWGIENNHIDDAFRFAMVGDFAAEIKKRPANFRIDLAELFYKAENRTMAGQIVDNIVLTSPGTTPAKRALFLRGQLFELANDLFAAHNTYLQLAESRYEPATTWYKAGVLSMLMQRESEGLKELEQAKRAGNVEAGLLIEQHKERMNTPLAPDVIPPIENRPGIDTNTGLTPKSKKDELLKAAQDVLNEGDLPGAKTKYLAAYKAYPNDLDVVRPMAALHYRMGNLDEARAFLDSVLKNNPNDAELLRFRANTLERLFDRKKDPQLLVLALKDYSQAVKVAPNHKFLNSEYARAKAKKK